MIKMVAEDDVSLSASKAEFQRLCAAAKANVGGGPPNFKDLRQNIAQILVNLDYNKDWRQRCIVVLGLPSYIEALSRQADSLNMMSVDLENAIDTDRSTFERHFEALKQSILRESDELYKSVQFLADLKATSAERQMAVNVRTAERDEEKNKLAQAKDANKKAETKLKEIQADLFALQQKMGQALQRNDQLEGELRKLELKR
jgi:septal ring factor EnvC (AmiA/AmiB activator)